MPRNDGRSEKDLREIKFTRGWLDHAEGSVLVEFGKTRVLCVASFTPGVPRWLKDTGNGWVTSEYSMLPRATHTRSDRESVKGKLGGRTQEISRLVGTDMNVVVAGDGRFIEVQGTAEGEPFDRALLNQLLDLAVAGCATLNQMQKDVLAK